jgi:hypothetical protein
VAIAVAVAAVGGGAIGGAAFGGATSGGAAVVPHLASALTGAPIFPSGSSGNTGAGNTGAGSGTTNGVPTVTVTGTGTASGTPDTLTIDIGATTDAATAADALNKNDAEMTTLDHVFTGAGANPSDLQTSDLELNPNYDAAGAITGYEVTDSLTVTLTNLANAGSVIDAAAGAVGNDVRLNGVSFSISDTSSLMKSARSAAIANATAEATDLAVAAGDKLGPALSINDTEDDTPNNPSPIFANAAAKSAAATPVPVQSGSEAVTVSVDVVYELLAAQS